MDMAASDSCAWEIRTSYFHLRSCCPSLGYALRNVQPSSDARFPVDFHYSMRARPHHAQHHSGSTFTFQNLHHNQYVGREYGVRSDFFCQLVLAGNCYGGLFHGGRVVRRIPISCHKSAVLFRESISLTRGLNDSIYFPASRLWHMNLLQSHLSNSHRWLILWKRPMLIIRSGSQADIEKTPT